MGASTLSSPLRREVKIASGEIRLDGELALPADAIGLVLFAHGSGSGRHSPRNQFVARVLNDSGIGTLLFDLLTLEEESADAATGHLRFDIGLLADRLALATEWVNNEPEAGKLSIGYFGASTGGGAALVAASNLGTTVAAVVSRGGRPDLAGDALPKVRAPTLLLVGGLDGPVIRMNQDAYARLGCIKELTIIPGATHLFEEPGTLQSVARHAVVWFRKYLKGVDDER